MSDERFKVTFEQAAVGIAHVLPDGKFLRINQKFCDIVGYTKKEMQSRTFQEITHPEDLDTDLEFVQQVLDGEIDTYSMEKRYLRKNHEIVWINLTVSLLREDTGEPSYFIAVVQDITERKEVEDRFRLLVEQAGDAFFILDDDGVIFDINRQACLSSGYSREELLGMKISEVDIEVEEKQHKFQCWDSLKPGHYITLEGMHRRKDGSTFPVEIRLGRLDLKEKRLLLALARDITERKEKEEKLQKYSKFQQLVSKISNKFVGLSGDELHQAIQDTFSEVGKYFEVDAVRLYRLSPQGDIIDMRNAWVSESSVVEEETAEMHKMKYPQLAAHYLRGEAIVYGCPDECPQLPDLLKILKYAKITAGVGVPLEIDDSGVDVFALAKTQSEHVWPKDIVKHCKDLGQILLNAMRRTDAEISLKDRYDEIKELKSRLELENIHLRKEIEVLYSHDEIVGKSRAIKTVLSQAEQVAKQETSVLILGETGTGKELLARAIHNISPRKARAMITVNCAALPATLVEAELFGREKGAYTGALTKQAGRFEIADKSTVFLDEIGDLPLEMQVKLLRVLQEGKFERLGSNKTITVDVRVIAATNHDLEQAVREGRFRKDLFYRLSVFPITVPLLRERAEDIPMLVWTFVKDFGKRMGKTVENIPNKTMDKLMNYTWPGNVRELRNVIERAMILHSGQTLHIETIQAENQEIDQPTSLKEVERNHIQSVLAKTNWKVSGKNGAAEALGLKESTLRARMGKLGIKRGK
ncbi:sigma 54-interacting transcriptional regulator [Thermodesulfobacteriota bacterium]